MLNWSLIKSPTNWFTIVLMLVIAGIAGHLVACYFGMTPQVDKKTPDQITPATAPVDLGWDGTFNAIKNAGVVSA